MDRVLVSACLLGRPVRYDGSGKLFGHPVLTRWEREGRIVALCPEVAAGLSTPRPPAEIVGEGGGEGVIDGLARVVEAGGSDVTSSYLDAARIALDSARRAGCRFAVLTEGSPTCGSGFIHDGTFGGRRIPGRGTAAALLERHGIRVFPESRIAELDQLLDTDR